MNFFLTRLEGSDRRSAKGGLALHPTLARCSEDKAVCVLAPNAGDAVIAIAPDFRIRRANQAAVALFGAHAAVGVPLRELLTSAGLEISSVEPALPLRAILHLSARSSLILLECFALRRERGALLRAVVLPQARFDWLLPASQFLAAAAHEIRNPLAAIRALVQSLAQDPGIRSDEVGVAMAEIDRLNVLLNDLLSLLHPRPDAPEVVELDRLAEQAAAACQYMIQAKGQRFSLLLPAPGTVTVRGSAQRLLQLSLNLLRNASEAAPASGTIAFTVAAQNGEVLLEVRDDGPGFSPEARARLFEPFFTTKLQGTGLGLAICQRIAQQHGGRLEVPEEAGGTRVQVYLPAN